jgi:electron transfer flavoprotein beta subunit
VDPITGQVSVDPRRSELPPAEAAAVEHGLRVAEAWAGRVLVVSAGGPETDPALAELRTLGVEVLRTGPAGPGPGGGGLGHPPAVRSAAGAGLGAPAAGGRLAAGAGLGAPAAVAAADLAGQPAAVAGSLAAAISSRGRPRLVLCGDRSARCGVGAVPGLLAHALGLDVALGLVSLRVIGPGVLRAERRLDGGWREELEIAGPAVLSVEAAGVRLRRAPLAALLSGPAPVAVLPVGAAGAGGGGAGVVGGAGVGGVGAGGTETLRVTPYRPRPHPVPPPSGDAQARLLALAGALDEREAARLVGPLPPSEAADELLDYLARHGVGPSDSEGLAAGAG